MQLVRLAEGCGARPRLDPALLGEVDAVIDSPVPSFYLELMARFPRSRVILTVREPAAWLESHTRHYAQFERAHADTATLLPGRHRQRRRRCDQHPPSHETVACGDYGDCGDGDNNGGGGGTGNDNNNGRGTDTDDDDVDVVVDDDVGRRDSLFEYNAATRTFYCSNRDVSPNRMHDFGTNCPSRSQALKRYLAHNEQVRAAVGGVDVATTTCSDGDGGGSDGGSCCGSSSGDAAVSRRTSTRPRLLEMDIAAGDGWEKLCAFLGRDVPDQPFPHLNKAN